jgi:hypothetical protein
MATVIPESESEILRSSTILLIRLEEIQFGPWVKEEGDVLLRRDITMKVIIEEVLKGEVEQQPNQPFEFNVKQRGTGGFRVMDNYGLWSMVELTEGVKYVAFCHGASRDARILLNEENCEQLVSPERALEDTRAAMALEKTVSATDVLSMVANVANHGEVFARYVAARVKHPAPPADQPTTLAAEEVSSSSDEAFESLITLLEAPQTTDQARAAYLTSIHEEVTMNVTTPVERVSRVVRALFKLLTMPEAESLHKDIREVYLPNLLGLKNPPLRYSAAEVFQNQNDERLAVLSSLKQATADEAAPQLVQWLEELKP